VKKLSDFEISGSHSRKGNCWDNAPIESFFSHLKCEAIYSKSFNDMQEISDATISYINYYNKNRMQRVLGKKTPHQVRFAS
jgi:transposase InsO family protein